MLIIFFYCFMYFIIRGARVLRPLLYKIIQIFGCFMFRANYGGIYQKRGPQFQTNFTYRAHILHQVSHYLRCFISHFTELYHTSVMQAGVLWPILTEGDFSGTVKHDLKPSTKSDQNFFSNGCVSISYITKRMHFYIIIYFLHTGIYCTNFIVICAVLFIPKIRMQHIIFFYLYQLTLTLIFMFFFIQRVGITVGPYMFIMAVYLLCATFITFFTILAFSILVFAISFTNTCFLRCLRLCIFFSMCTKRISAVITCTTVACRASARLTAAHTAIAYIAAAYTAIAYTAITYTAAAYTATAYTTATYTITTYAVSTYAIAAYAAVYLIAAPTRGFFTYITMRGVKRKFRVITVITQCLCQSIMLFIEMFGTKTLLLAHVLFFKFLQIGLLIYMEIIHMRRISSKICSFYKCGVL
ncbi:pB407L [African swine fever virus]|uniref:PB407L n=1 Tax=African swine fever virus TaxID=10497 RepID=A0A8A1V2G0_ASF|nr:pB407L [African swine fever virus]